MKTVALHQRPDLVDQAAALMQDTWPGHYGPDGSGDARCDLQKRCRQQGLPFGLLALSDDGSVAGLGALDVHSYGASPGEDLWLIGLCTRPDQRKIGVGTMIARALMDHARRSGQTHIFTTTHTAAGLLEQLGWQRLRDFEDAHGWWQVLRVTL